MTTPAATEPATPAPDFNEVEWEHIYQEVIQSNTRQVLVLRLLQTYLPLTMKQSPYQVQAIFYMNNRFVPFVQHTQTWVVFEASALCQNYWKDLWVQPHFLDPEEWVSLETLLPLPVRHLNARALTYWLYFHQQKASVSFIQYWLPEGTATAAATAAATATGTATATTAAAAAATAAAAAAAAAAATATMHGVPAIASLTLPALPEPAGSIVTLSRRVRRKVSAIV